MRHLIDTLDGGVEQTYARSGLDYRPRYTPIVRALTELGPSSIRAISRRAGITHSAVSQTVAQMATRGLVTLRAGGGDARERIVALTSEAEAMLPQLERHWEATAAAARALDEELSMPLSALVEEVMSLLARRSFAKRIDDAAAKLLEPAKAKKARKASKATKATKATNRAKASKPAERKGQS